MSGYFDLPNTTLGGPSFVGLAELVADLTAKKDVSNADTDETTVDIGINNFELQNLVDAFGFNNMVNIARKRLIPTLSAEALPFVLPLDKIQALTTPVVLGAQFADDITQPVDQTGTTDSQFVASLVRGAGDISRNSTDVQGEWMKDRRGEAGSSTTGDYTYPYGNKTNAIFWTDLSSLTNAKNIRFNNDDSATDFSAVVSLVTDNTNGEDDKRTIKENRISGDYIYITGLDSAGPAGSTKDEGADENVLREKIYLDLYNLSTPAPTAKEVYNQRTKLSSTTSGGALAVYVKNGMFKNDIGKNKTYYTTPSDFKTLIDGKVSFPVGEVASDKWNEFKLMKEYGFSGSDTALQFAADLSGHGTTASSGAGCREAFAAIFGSTGGLADQLTDYGFKETFKNSDGIHIADISAANDVTSLTSLVDTFAAFIDGANDNHWSTSGMVEPTVYSGSKKQIWDNFQTQIARDPLLSERMVGSIPAEQEKRLRVFLEMHKAILTNDTRATTDVVTNMQGVSSVGTVGSYTNNHLVLGISGGIVGTGNEAAGQTVENVTQTVDGPKPTKAAELMSVISFADTKSWDTTGILGNANNFNGLFTIDAAYNLRSRIPGLDIMEYNMTETRLSNLLDNSIADTRQRNHKKWTAHHFGPSNTAAPNAGTSSKSSSLHAGDFFTPGQFQKSFINTSNLQQAANVALRYFNCRDLSNVQANNTDSTGHFGYQDGNNRTVFPTVLRDLKKKSSNDANIANDIATESQNASYAANVPEMKYVYDGLVRSVLPNEKSAIQEILSWSPVPPQLYADVLDHSQYVKPQDQVDAAKAAKNFNLTTTDANYINRSRPKLMAHVLCNYFLDASYNTVANKPASKSQVANAHSIVTLLEVEPTETIKALEGFGKNTTHSPSPYGLNVYSDPGALSGVVRNTIEEVLASMVQYGKTVSLFKTVANALEPANNSADLIVDAYLRELDDFLDATSDAVTFGDSSSAAYVTNQHLGYWMPYLALLSGSQIAERVRNEEGLLTIENNNQIKVLGLLKAATKGKLGSAVAADAPARIAGLNAMFDAGVPKAFADLAWTERGVNAYTNFAGSKYEVSLDNFN